MKVWNKHDPACPEDAVYIGRGSPWGNRYTHKDSAFRDVIKVASREEAIRRFEADVRADPLMMERIVKELKSRSLVCFCKPAACHGDVLFAIANAEKVVRLPLRRTPIGKLVKK